MCLQSVANMIDPDVPESVLPGRVLVADDEHLAAVSMGDHLRQLGVEVIGPASNGKHAIDLAREDKPDLALIDIRMPEMDGLQAAGVLFRQMQIPVIIVSAFSDEAYVQDSAKIGVFGYLVKPISAGELRSCMAVAWARYNDHQKLQQSVMDLTQALEDRKIVERAKGLLMKKLGLDEEQAMRRLQKQARDSRRKLADMARAMLDTDALLNPPHE